MKDKYAIALIQMSMSRDRRENLEKAEAMIINAASDGAEVVCLPELFLTPYFCQVEDAGLFDLAETIPGAATESLGRLAQDRGVTIVASLFEKRAIGLYHNTTAVITGEGISGTYRKSHIPDDPCFYEKFYFTPGDTGFRVFSDRGRRLGVLICWDQWYPEAARLTALKGAEVIFYPTAIGWHPAEKDVYGEEQLDAWFTAQRAHAIASGVYVAPVNRIGHEIMDNAGAGLIFWGTSFICDPMGKILAKASADREEILLAEVDLGRMEAVRRGWPFLRDRRIDLYGDLTRRYWDE